MVNFVADGIAQHNDSYQLNSAELKPDYGVAYYNLAVCYLNLHDNYSAKEVYKKLVHIDPNMAQKLKKHLLML